MNQLKPLLSMTDTSVRRNGCTVFSNLTIQIQPGECWAITGPTGSGKTTLLQTLAAQLPLSAGRVTRHQPVAFVSFREESRQFSYSSHFYQQRYQATMSDEGSRGQPAPTLRNFLQLTSPTDATNAEALLNRLGLLPLLDRTLLKLSNGQTRKARIGKALLQQPSALLLDNPFVGLDAVFRYELTQWLGQLTHDGLTLILVTDAHDIPPFTTHVLAFDTGQNHWTGPASLYQPEQMDTSAVPVPILQTPIQPTDFSAAFQMQDVTVRYGDTVILDKINWSIQPGERWALLGPNGAGKSVLLSLLYGDHPQAYANDIRIFDHRRGRGGQSIWDVKRRIGFVSPELHLYFPQHLTTRQVILSGLTDTLTPAKAIRPETETDLTTLLTYFGLAEHSSRAFGQLSAGQQRVVLLIRALIKNPPVLILDEPFQALDAEHVSLARQLIDSLPNKTILFVTHDRNELPTSIDRLFSL